MASDFIYILSSLPLLRLSGEGAADYGAFLESCGGMLSPRERKTLEELTLQPLPGTPREEPVLCRWDQWLSTMRQVAALWRAARTRREASPSWRPRREECPGDVRRLEAILAMEGLAAKQEAWEALQWSRLEELSREHAFDFPSLLLYALKLRLLEQRARRTLEAGTQAFEEAVASRLEEAARGRVSAEEQ